MKRRLICLVGFIFVFLCAAFTIGNGRCHCQTVISKTMHVTKKRVVEVPVERDPTRVGVNPNTNRIYVANRNSNTVSMIDGATNKVIATMEMEVRQPFGIGVNPNTNRIYVTHIQHTIVSVIDGTTNKVIAKIMKGGGGGLVGVNSNTNRVYVACFFGEVRVTDGISNEVIANISAGENGANGGNVGVNSNTNRVYVTNSSMGIVTVIDGATNKVIAFMNAGKPVGIDVNPNTNRVYVANRDSNTVSVIYENETNPVKELRDEFLKKNGVDESYYPLKEGMTWQYHYSFRDWNGFGTLKSGTIKGLIANLAPRELKGKTVTPQKADIEGTILFSYIFEDSNGIYEFAKQTPGEVEPEINPSPVCDLKYPIQVGTTWSNGTLKSTIESIDEVVTVSAGTFKGCVKVKRIGAIKEDFGAPIGVANIRTEVYAWYAPGVGSIKQIIKQTSDTDFVGSSEKTMQLESFKK